MKYELQTIIGMYPRLFLPIVRYRHTSREQSHWLSPRCVRADTGLVIEGFPRSGNTFAVVAFRVAQVASPPAIAHHLHAPSQVLEGLRWGIPTIVLIRHPADAVVSLVIRHPEISLGQALRGYLRFYRPLQRHLGRFVTATFEQVTSDFGEVIQRTNARYGRSFSPFEHDEESTEACFRIIEERNRSLSPGREVSEVTVARPSQLRAERRADLLEKLRGERYTDPLRKAERVFLDFRSSAEHGGKQPVVPPSRSR